MGVKEVHIYAHHDVDQPQYVGLIENADSVGVEEIGTQCSYIGKDVGHSRGMRKRKVRDTSKTSSRDTSKTSSRDTSKIKSKSTRKSDSSFSGWYKQIFEDMEEPRISEVLIENMHNIDAENLNGDEGDNAHNFDADDLNNIQG